MLGASNNVGDLDCPAPATEPSSVVAAQRIKSKHVLYSRSEKIGSVNSVRSMYKTASGFELFITDNTCIFLKNMTSNYRLFGEERTFFDQSGLVGYRAKSRENEISSEVGIEKYDDSLHVRGVVDSERFDLNIPVKSYDAISENAPWFFLLSEEHSKTVTVLDLDEYKNQDIRYQHLEKEIIKLGSKSVTCHVLEFQSTLKSGRVSVVEDGTGIWVLGESGEDRDGEYSIVLEDYNVDIVY